VERSDLALRASRHAALGDPVRLAIVDDLAVADRAPVELQRHVGVASNLLAHHLEVLHGVGLITRTRSSGDGRRRYVHLDHGVLAALRPGQRLPAGPALFVCTHNSARSQLAAALWHALTRQPATSAGTHPADRVHRGAIAAGRRAGLDLGDARPRHLDDIQEIPPIVVTVCDRAHEELDPGPGWLHWSITDPVPEGTRTAFDATVTELRRRITTVVDRGAA
jgi:ArsR family transcriptional regulator, arsenate/arsenite/antimonite-responsive transcriptional repressor / arsenate reductase (thioredoxin)